MELVILFLLKTKCRFNCNSIFDRNPYLWLQIQQETVVLSLQAYVQGPKDNLVQLLCSLVPFVVRIIRHRCKLTSMTKEKQVPSFSCSYRNHNHALLMSQDDIDMPSDMFSSSKVEKQVSPVAISLIQFAKEKHVDLPALHSSPRMSWQRPQDTSRPLHSGRGRCCKSRIV